jgi:hypothetical protein
MILIYNINIVRHILLFFFFNTGMKIDYESKTNQLLFQNQRLT